MTQGPYMPVATPSNRLTDYDDIRLTYPTERGNRIIERLRRFDAGHAFSAAFPMLKLYLATGQRQLF